jgi:gamma-glutamyltranspeptidase/glutathione hydrolase
MLNAIDFGMDAQQAVSAPRFAAVSDTIEISNRIPRAAERALLHMGYQVTRHPYSYTFAWVHMIRLRDGVLDGGADPATDGMAIAV